MWLKRVAPPKLLSEFIERCKTTGYLDADVSDKYLKNLKFLPMGERLRDNINNEWEEIGKFVKSNIKMYAEKDVTIDSNNSSIISFVDRYKKIAKDMDPNNMQFFGVAETKLLKRNTFYGISNNEKLLTADLSSGGKQFISYFITNEEQSMEHFQLVQQLRKFWWMKYASNPGRFSISEKQHEKIRNLKVETVWLLANYKFGQIPLESIQLLPGACFQTIKVTPKSEPLLKNQIIRSTVLLDIATLQLAIDSFDAADFGEMCLHRKIAPFQISIYCLSKDADNLDTLKELARLLQLKFEKLRISTMDLEECLFQEPELLALKYQNRDNIGVPYGILLEDDTLKTGFLKLRNRDTTLHESIHISCIEDYLLKILNS